MDGGVCVTVMRILLLCREKTLYTKVVHAQALREREERIAAGEVDVPEPELPSLSPEQM